MLGRSLPVRRRGVTFIEILTVISLLGALTVLAGGISASVLSYYRLRGAAEMLLWDLRRAHDFALAMNRIPRPTGLTVFTNRLSSDRRTAEPGFSYLVWGPNGAVKPTGSVTDLPERDRGFVENLPLGVRIVQTSQLPAAVDVANGTTFEFDGRGLLTGPSPGDVTVHEASGGDFLLLVAGGTARSFPALRMQSP